MAYSKSSGMGQGQSKFSSGLATLCVTSGQTFSICGLPSHHLEYDLWDPVLIMMFSVSMLADFSNCLENYFIQDSTYFFFQCLRLADTGLYLVLTKGMEKSNLFHPSFPIIFLGCFEIWGNSKDIVFTFSLCFVMNPGGKMVILSLWHKQNLWWGW